jgi:hypothetical protein
MPTANRTTRPKSFQFPLETIAEIEAISQVMGGLSFVRVVANAIRRDYERICKAPKKSSKKSNAPT